MSNSESHRYYANSIGFVAFCALLAFGIQKCSERDSIQMEQEKTKRIEILNRK